MISTVRRLDSSSLLSRFSPCSPFCKSINMALSCTCTTVVLYSAWVTDTRSAGTFKQPLFTDGTKTTCSGVDTVDGTRHYANKVVLAAGAWSPTSINLDEVSHSHHIKSAASSNHLQAWVFAHIPLTPAEEAQYKNSPVVYDGDYSFFFKSTK